MNADGVSIPLGAYYQLLEQVATSTESGLILFFVIVAAMMVPLYWVMLKDRKHTRQHESEKHSKYIEREREIINVIREIGAVMSENSAVTAELKSLLVNHKVEIKESIRRINDRCDAILNATTENNTVTKAILAEINRRNNGRRRRSDEQKIDMP